MNHLVHHSKRVLFTLALAVGGLLAAAPAAHAASGPVIQRCITNIGSVCVEGGGFTPYATVYLTMLTPDLRVDLGRVKINADGNGAIYDGNVPATNLPCWQSYSGEVLVAADGEPGPTAWVSDDLDVGATCVIPIIPPFTLR